MSSVHGLRLSAVALILLILCLPGTCPGEDDVTPCIGGKAGWWSVGDTVMFLGDCGTASPRDCTMDCYCFEEGCWHDFCFTFVTLTGVDLENCTGTEGTSYGVNASGCFWLGLDEGSQMDCFGCESNDYCLSIWRVESYNSLPGDFEQGCYGLSWICGGGYEDECVDTPPDEHCHY